MVRVDDKVRADGHFEGGLAVAAGMRVRGRKYNTKSESNFKNKCAPVCRIHVSFAYNQQPAHCRITHKGSAMKSGFLATKTENRKQMSKSKYNTKPVNSNTNAAAKEYSLTTCRARSRNSDQLSKNSAPQRGNRMKPREQRYICLRCGRRQQPVAAPLPS
jgi:hypothetical protein